MGANQQCIFMELNNPNSSSPRKALDGIKTQPANAYRPSIDSIRPDPIRSPSFKVPAAIPNQATNRSMLNTSIPAKGIGSKQNFRAKRRGKNSSGKRPHSKKKKILSLVALLIVGGLAAAGWDAWQLYHKVNHLSVGNLTASVNGDENILVAGSTNRCNLTVQNAQWGFCSQGVTGVNSDVIFVVHLNATTHAVSVLSIPRDTFVPNARSGAQAFKIDAALYQGPSQLVKAIEVSFGIPIQHYVEVGFDGFVNIVNAVGGVKMYFPMPVYDAYSHLKILTPGCKLLNGVEALQVVRARHLQYKGPGVTTNDYNYWPQEVASDIARITRAHEFIKVLASAILAKGLANPITDQKLIDAIAPQVQVDAGLSVPVMLQLIAAFHSVGINNVPELTLPIALTNFGSYIYGGYNYGDVVFPAAPQDVNTIDQFLGITSATNPLTDKPFPAANTISVSVVNGSGTPNQASVIASGLGSLGFQINGQPGTAAPLSTQAQETIVYYGSPSTQGDALAVASKLSGYVVLSHNASDVSTGSLVTVLTGTNAAVIGASSSTQGASGAPNAVAASTNANALAPPINANQSLAPWDPRACPGS